MHDFSFVRSKEACDLLPNADCQRLKWNDSQSEFSRRQGSNNRATCDLLRTIIIVDQSLTHTDYIHGFYYHRRHCKCCIRNS